MIIFRYFYSNIGSLVDSEQFSKSLYNKGIPGTVIRFVFRTASTTGSKLAIYGSVAFAMCLEYSAYFSMYSMDK